METINRIGRFLMLCVVLLVVVFVILPYLVWGEARDYIRRQVNPDIVWIQELNPHFWNIPGDKDPGKPEYPLTTEFDERDIKNYYTK